MHFRTTTAGLLLLLPHSGACQRIERGREMEPAVRLLPVPTRIAAASEASPIDPPAEVAAESYRDRALVEGLRLLNAGRYASAAEVLREVGPEAAAEQRAVRRFSCRRCAAALQRHFIEPCEHY